MLLSAREVTRRYGRVVALAPTSLDIESREAVALIGPNGAGKSTLLSILAGALEPTDGRVESNDGTGRIGWVPQRPAHYSRLTPRENLELFARLEGVDDPLRTAGRFIELLELPDDGRLTAQLSAGNQQRLNLALALLGRPEVLLLDEPTASLDPAAARAARESIRAMVRRDGCGALWTSHNMLEVEEVCDRVLFLSHGRVLLQGDPKTLPEEHGASSLDDLFVRLASEPLTEPAA